MMLISASSFVLAEKGRGSEGDEVRIPPGEDPGEDERAGIPPGEMDGRFDEKKMPREERRERIEERREVMKDRLEEQREMRGEEGRPALTEEQRAEMKARFEARENELRMKFEEKMRTPEGKEEIKMEFREKLREERELRFEEHDLSVKLTEDEKKELIVGKINAKTGLNLTVDDLENESVRGALRAELSNGRFAQIKVMPDKAAAIALYRMRANCPESTCSVALKEVGEGDEKKLAYEIETEQESSFLFFKRKIAVRAEVDAETGKIIRTHKPWWAFFTNEQEATDDEVEAETGVSVEEAVPEETNILAIPAA
jgi:hypothetical protein